MGNESGDTCNLDIDETPCRPTVAARLPGAQRDGSLAPVERYHEGKSIDAVLRCIEARWQIARRDDGWSPDDANDPDPDRRVDYVCTVGNQIYALEHTGIEPFADQIKMGIRNQALFGPIFERFDRKRSDDEVWELHYPVDAAMNLSGAEVTRTRNALISWLENDAAASVPVNRYLDRIAYRPGVQVAGVPFKVTLYRWSLTGIPGLPSPCPLAGRFWPKPFVRGDLEAARLARLQRACEDKFPKLAKWKPEGATTVLVLEENDLSLTNHQVVADAVLHLVADATDPPDEIFLVSTDIAETWHASCLRRDGKTYYDDGERFHEFDPAALTKLTKR
jgi:hypothetical protein